MEPPLNVWTKYTILELLIESKSNSILIKFYHDKSKFKAIQILHFDIGKQPGWRIISYFCKGSCCIPLQNTSFFAISNLHMVISLVAIW